MKKTAKALVPILALVAAIAVAAPSLAASEIIFYGYAIYTPATGVVGATLDVYGVANPGSVATPIPFNWAGEQYTIHISSMAITSYVADSVPVGSYTLDRQTTVFGGGALSVFADATAGGTAADYASLATFTDGVEILAASVDPGFTSILSDGPVVHDGIFVGSGSGTCDFNAGTRLGELVAAEYYLDDWFLGGTPISDPNPTVPSGFTRVFNVKIVSPNDPTAAEEGTWGGVKALYR